MSYSSGPTSVCTVTSAGVLTFVSAGACTINADQAGNTNYAAASTASQTFNITQGTQTISFTAPASQTYSPNGTVSLSATGGASGNPVTFASTSTSVCTTGGSNGATVTFVSVGQCNITASQAASTNYAAATDVPGSFNITKASQTVSFTSTVPTTATVGGATYTPSASATSGLAAGITVDASSSTACSISNGIVSFNAQGTCTLDANQAGNGTYSAATQVQQSFSVGVNIPKVQAAAATGSVVGGTSIVTNLPNINLNTISQLEHFGGEGSSFPSSPNQLANDPPQVPQTNTQASVGLPNAVIPSQSGTGTRMPDVFGLQQMAYGAIQQLGQNQQVTSLNYSGPFEANLNGLGSQTTGKFRASLASATEWADKAQAQEAAALGYKTSSTPLRHYNPLNVWIEGTYTLLSGTSTGNFGMVTTGADYTFSRSMLVGFLAQVDGMNITNGQYNQSTGWMMGPYATLRLTDHLFWANRFSYGRSSNNMQNVTNPALLDYYGATRWLGSSALQGRWQIDQLWAFKPNLTGTYYNDTTDTFVNAQALTVPSTTNSVAQVSLSPEFSNMRVLDNGATAEISLAPQVIWNNTSSSVANAVSSTALPQGVRGAFRGGLNFRTVKGVGINVSGTYDGIGTSGYTAITGDVKVSVPLN